MHATCPWHIPLIKCQADDARGDAGVLLHGDHVVVLRVKVEHPDHVVLLAGGCQRVVAGPANLKMQMHRNHSFPYMHAYAAETEAIGTTDQTSTFVGLTPPPVPYRSVAQYLAHLESSGCLSSPGGELHLGQLLPLL